MFLQEEDYSALIRDEIKALLQEGYSSTKMKAAEQMAIHQVKNYLSGKYDAQSIFEQEGTNRNSHIVMITIDLVLYHLYTSTIPDRMPTIRAERYQDAIDWLKLVASGNAMADLPKINKANGDALNGIRISSKYKPNNHKW
ncbi:phage protein Gp36 family protein [Psychroflexus sp. ALD_RP9]|uniref:phage protein Gp36 family protein n=1 Tax=Psychroflexus sp. ALD_RP9 TaxID=2777186 RepID=UPI001A8E92C9|nr:phage protein Gp36 family protein [Psychroflexus sp. ALD_RP9]QSS96595.1 DUF1320 family protein [Psychroflexus sp. ALD_RP9]